ncbi:sensor histidine kinase [Rugamonas rubra]|uniref:histidine kinase n=1 Tax=Rugamonas rubra TaxID=758825 RepID=A0A1I4UWI9_9BURK|nr:HAMP domain-containing histidine kinase [Rugamonas rubra]SFM93113.1 Signal transduction histidine kinase [Rugamonas rubra]
MFSSIRHGLFAALAGFTVLICLCYTGLALVISYVTEDMLVDRLLQREAAAISAHFHLRGEVKTPGDELIRVYRSVAALPPVVRAQVAAGRERAEISTDSGPHYHLRTLDLPAGSAPRRVYLLADARPLLVVSALFRDVGGVLVSVALGLIALALLLAYLLSRRLVAPLQVLAKEVRGLSRDQPIAFSARHRRDEIGFLADRLGSTIAELHSSLNREHAFTRDVGHELRTPLTVMNNILGQAESRPLAAQDVAQLLSGLDDIATTVDVLFALARAEHIAEETLDLRGCIEESLLRLLDDGAWEEGCLELQLPDHLAVRGNRHLAMLLINNCLGNALFHGGAGSRLRLAFADGVLSLGNTVDPARAGTTQGFLHGQNLLRRIATAMRWEIGFHAGATAYRVDIVPLRPH